MLDVCEHAQDGRLRVILSFVGASIPPYAAKEADGTLEALVTTRAEQK